MLSLEGQATPYGPRYICSEITIHFIFTFYEKLMKLLIFTIGYFLVPNLILLYLYNVNFSITDLVDVFTKQPVPKDKRSRRQGGTTEHAVLYYLFEEVQQTTAPNGRENPRRWNRNLPNVAESFQDS